MKQTLKQQSKQILKQQSAHISVPADRNTVNQDNPILKLTKLFFFLLPFCFGLFYEWASCISGICFTGILIWTAVSEKKSDRKLKIPCGLSALLLLAILFLYLFTSIYAVDWGMALLGFVKFLPIFIFAILTAQFEAKEKMDILNTIPYSACVMTLLSFAFYFTPWKRYFYRAERLGGFFQYSNTFALILFLGIIILLFQKKREKQHLFIMAVLTMGILISGSRGVFILAVLFFFILGIKSFLQKRRKKTEEKESIFKTMFAVTILLVFSVCAIFAVSTGNTQMFSRFLSISLSSSTFIGRLLYYRDAIAIIFRHPLGLGYMGYRYLCGSEQTGVYQIQYVHNDFLQIGLDIGIIGLVLFIVLFCRQIFNRQTSSMQKILCFIIALHCCMDFDLQFLFVDLILVLCVDFGKVKTIEKKRAKIILTPAAVLSLGIFAYMFLPLFYEYMGCHAEASMIYPYYTEANINKMFNEPDMGVQNKIAGKIIEQNNYCSDAYYVRAVYDINNKVYDSMIQNQKRLIELEKYTIENYERYIEMLSAALGEAADKKEEEKIQEYIRYVLEVPEILKEVQNNTSRLAYKINDKPELELNQAYEEYIETLKNVLK